MGKAVPGEQRAGELCWAVGDTVNEKVPASRRENVSGTRS